MSLSQRYSDPQICDHLARQYVAGSMTPRVRRRTARLLAEQPALAAAVNAWSERLAPLQTRMPEYPPPAQLWQNIQSEIRGHSAAAKPVLPRPNWLQWLSGGWYNLSALRIGAMASALASLLLVIYLWQRPTDMIVASYMAPLSRDGQIELVISAYRDETSNQRQLTLQWSKQAQHKPAGVLYLWAEDRKDHHLSPLGPLPSGNRHWPISADAWHQIAGSSRLLIGTRADQLDLASAVYQGPCLQLGVWKEG